MQHDKSDLYERVTSQIVEAIEKRAGKYRMPWHAAGGDYFAPTNAVSLNPYRGINVVTLWAISQKHGYESGLWATFNQWKALGAQVRKGEKAALVVFWKVADRKDEELEESEQTEEAKSGRGVLAKGYYVFNVAQVEGYTPPEVPKLSEKEQIERADDFFRSLRADVRQGGGVAGYDPEADVIHMPRFELFREATGYYSILAHEMTHWTGSPKRLNREMTARFGSEGYAMEEHIAELGAAFLCASLRITNPPRPDHAAYLANWLEVLKRDKRALFHAASQAQKAADWMHLEHEERQSRAT